MLFLHAAVRCRERADPGAEFATELAEVAKSNTLGLIRMDWNLIR
jgi:hypothetical protein